MKSDVLRYFFFSFLSLLLYITPAHAHKVKMFAAAEGDVITGYVYYTTGGKPKHATVLVENRNGKRLGEVPTDENGEFTFKPETRQDYIFILELADGHRATFRVTANELPESLAAAEIEDITPPDDHQQTELGGEKIFSTDAPPLPQNSLKPRISLEELEKIIDKVVNKQIRPLREQLEQYEEKIRLHDILGGIGYIVGLMGLGYFLSMQKKTKTSRKDAKTQRKNK